MKISAIEKKSIAIDILALMVIFLFVYAAVNKFMDYDKFVIDLGMSPYFGQKSAPFIGTGVIFIEIGISLMLLFSRTKTLAFILSLFLMTCFTVYIYLLQGSETVPCSCGGILGKLSWDTHIYFNIFFMAVSFCGYMLNFEDGKVE